ncbi:MAG: hypothetical protein ACI9LM_005621, partial [Alteromonadaceae bacterium]
MLTGFIQHKLCQIKHFNIKWTFNLNGFYFSSLKHRLLLISILLCCALSCAMNSANAANAYKADIYFDQLSLENGLNQGSIFAVTTDFRGLTWIGTQDGLHIFDGSTLQLVNLNNTDKPKYRFI